MTRLPSTAPGRAAFFDLDKTLVRVNTGPLYVRWRVRQRRMGVGDLARVTWWSLLYTFGRLDAERISAAAAATLAGVDEGAFRAECAAWVEEEIFPHVTVRARTEVARHHAEGTPCALLTSSSRYIAEPVAAMLGVDDVICSDVEVREGRFTGGLASPLCYGPRKVTEAQRWADARGVDLGASAFYTDSVTDLPMLAAVGEPRVINPDPLLSREARRRGWSVESWT